MKYSATWFLNDRLNTPVPYLTEEHCSCVNTAAVVSVSIPHCTPIPSYNGRQYSDPCYSILLWIKFGGCAVNIIYCPRPTAAHTAHIWHNPLRVSCVHLIYVGIRLLLMDQFRFTDKNKGMCVRICTPNSLSLSLSLFFALFETPVADAACLCTFMTGIIDSC